MEKEKTVLIVAGEASGDLHASCLVKAIRGLYPEVKFFGLGGKKLQQQQVNLLFDIVDMAVVGFLEVLKNFKKIQSIFHDLLKEIDKNKPDLAILVDYPGFNLELAKQLKIRNIPVIYYISPQVWAWGKGRIKTIKETISRMVVVFKFEEELYKSYNVPVSFVGHPLLDVVKADISKEDLFKKLDMDLEKITVSLLPGSREKEVKLLLPVMLETSRLLSKHFNHRIQFLILRSSTVKEEIFNSCLSGYNLPIKLLTDMTYNGIAASDFCLVASGTATLETAILKTPMAILYKVSFLTWLYIRLLIKIPYIGLVNVVKGRKIAEEFIQFDAQPKKIANYVIGVLEDESKLNQIKYELSTIKTSLGEKNASLSAAQIVVDFLKNSS